VQDDVVELAVAVAAAAVVVEERGLLFINLGLFISQTSSIF
jgi:hypothetical protein